MGRLSSRRFAVAAFILIAVMEATSPAGAQNLNDLLTIFGGDKQRAAKQAQAQWHRLPPAEMACIDQRLRHKGSSVEALIRRGVKPSAARLIELRSTCREFVQGAQTDTAPALAGDANGSPTPTVSQSNSNEPKDAGVTPSAEPPIASGVTSSAESPKESSAKLLSKESVGRVAEQQVQQGEFEQKNSVPELGIMGWLGGAFLFALVAIAALLGIVTYLFVRWRNTGQRTVPVSRGEKNSQGAVKAPLDATTGEGGEVVGPLADKMSQLPDKIGEDAATTSMSQNSPRSSEIQSSNEEVLPDSVSIEPSDSSTTASSVENVAQLAKLCAMGTPSEKDFQRIKGLISQRKV